MMVRHIVIWKLTDEAKDERRPERIAKLKGMFAALPGKIPGLISAELAEDCAGEGYDLVLCADFESKEAVAVYQSHPLHLAVKETGKNWLFDRASADYER